MADISGQSSDLIKQVTNPSETYNIYEGTVTMPNPLDITYSTGYGAFVEVDITALNLGIQVPEVSAVRYYTTNMGGGVTRYSHDTLPFVRWDTNGAIFDSAYMNIYYDAFVKDNPIDATSKLVIWFYSRTSSTGGQTFYYKIKSTSAIPPA